MKTLALLVLLGSTALSDEPKIVLRYGPPILRHTPQILTRPSIEAPPIPLPRITVPRCPMETPWRLPFGVFVTAI